MYIHLHAQLHHESFSLFYQTNKCDYESIRAWFVSFIKFERVLVCALQQKHITYYTNEIAPTLKGLFGVKQ